MKKTVSAFTTFPSSSLFSPVDTTTTRRGGKRSIDVFIRQQQQTNNFGCVIDKPLSIQKRSSPCLYALPPFHTFDSSSSFSSLSSTTAAVASTSSPPTTATTTFEPVLNIPALSAFVFIMTMALVLVIRVNQINDAADKRIIALQTLREIKSKELSNQVTNEQVQSAIMSYTNALEKEESLRTIVPGIVRLRAPNNPQQSELDQQAIRQFLNNNNNNNNSNNDGNNTSTTTTEKRSSDKTDTTENNNNKSAFMIQQQQQQQQQLQQDEYDTPSNLPTWATSTLWLFLFGSQIMLFLFLSMDDTTANEVWNSLSSSGTFSTGTGTDTTDDTRVIMSKTVAESIGDLIGME